MLKNLFISKFMIATFPANTSLHIHRREHKQRRLNTNRFGKNVITIVVLLHFSLHFNSVSDHRQNKIACCPDLVSLFHYEFTYTTKYSTYIHIWQTYSTLSETSKQTTGTNSIYQIHINHPFYLSGSR